MTVILLLFAVLTAVPAQAVHDTGAFQLDGNAQTSVDSSPTAAEDWDMVCPPGTPPGVSPFCLGGTIADVHTFKIDPSASSVDNILTGGGTKDDLDVPNWKWKSAKPSPPKNDIGNAFAAEYTVADYDSSGEPHNVLFFGGDRISNNGDANIAFWFFHNRIGAPGDGGTPELPICSAGSGCSFTGKHKAGDFTLGGDTVGDILIVSAFTSGGTQPTIKIYEWVGPGNATKPCFTNACTLQPIVLPNQGATQACDGEQIIGDKACAIVNSVLTPSPWAFREADGKVADNYFKDGDFYEGGLDLTGLGIGDECFSSFLINTRSSQSGDSVLHDFVLGEFGRCGATVTTEPSAGMGNDAVSPGTPVTDTATVTGTGPANPPTPVGNVTFYLCGPTADTDTVVCADGDTVGSGTGVPLAELDTGTATATSAEVNTQADPLEPGRWCFRAEWPGDDNYTDGPYGDGPYAPGTENTECFVVRRIATTTVTTPSEADEDSIPDPLGLGVDLGTHLFDLAVVKASATGGGNVTGHVNFYICDPTEVSGDPGSEVCADGDTPAGTQVGSSRTLVPDSGASPPSSRVLSSPGVVADMAGVWCFRATYVPTGTTYTGSSDNSHNECVKVNPDTTTTVTTPSDESGDPIKNPLGAGVVLSDSDTTYVRDYALVTGTPEGGTPTGDVTFYICDPDQVSGDSDTTAYCADGDTVGSGSVPLAELDSTVPNAEATSDKVEVDKLGVWCFRAEFTPSGSNAANYTGSSDASHTECFVVRTTSSSTSAQDWLPNDSVTVTSVGGFDLDGTLDITLREGADCDSAVVYTEPLKTLSDTASGTTFTTNNTDVHVSSSGEYWWKAVFTSTNPLVGSYTKCERTNITINNNP